MNFYVPSGTSNGSNSLILYSAFKERSNEYSHAQIRVKTKKLWPRQVREEKPVAVQKISRDRKWCRDQEMVSRQEMVSQPGNGVATENGVATRKLGRDQKRCRNIKKAEN